MEVVLHEYGPPLYAHLTPASWELCLLARGAVESIIESLDLDIKFYHENCTDAAAEGLDRTEVTEAKQGQDVSASKRLADRARSSSGAGDGRSTRDVPEGGGPSRLASRLNKPPLQGAPPSPAAATAAGIPMTRRSQDGFTHEVTVPILSLPKKANDSFEKRLLGRKNSTERSDGSALRGGRGHARGGHAGSHSKEQEEEEEEDTVRSSRIAARFKRK
jgi:hypothetical protein